MRLFFFLSLFTFSFLTYSSSRAEPLETSSQHVFIFDYQTGNVIFDKNSREPIHPASMSKLMTVYMLFDALKKGNIKLTDTFHVNQKAWSMQGSKMYVELNSDIKVEDLIRGIIVQSGNDACVVVAEGLAGSEEAFAKQMNKVAKDIGLQDSNFVNASGWPDPAHLMSARDLGVLAYRLLTDFPEFYHYFSEREFTWHGIKQGNRNPLLYRANSGVDGLKTGHTEEAGFGVTTSAIRNNRRIIMVIHGLTSMQDRADEAGRVLDWAFRTTDNYKLATKGSPLAEIPVWLGQQKTISVAAAQDFIATLPIDQKSQISAKIHLDKIPVAPVAAGTIVGQLIIQAGQQQPISVPLVTINDSAALGAMGRLGYNLSHLFSGAN